MFEIIAYRQLRTYIVSRAHAKILQRGHEKKTVRSQGGVSAGRGPTFRITRGSFLVIAGGEASGVETAVEDDDTAGAVAVGRL
jgi:hypothetical protein